MAEDDDRHVDTNGPRDHQWPEDEPVSDPRPERPRSRRDRVLRAPGDVFATAGIGRALSGGARGAADKRATTNLMLFGKGEAEGREANRGASSERP